MDLTWQDVLIFVQGMCFI